ncbi:MAG: sialidase family protein [Planctomycetota bacterium]
MQVPAPTLLVAASLALSSAALAVADQRAGSQAPAGAVEPSSEPGPIDVWTSGVGGYHTYRIPSVIATRSGALLAFCEGRKSGRGDTGDIDLLRKRSTDGGQTWSAHSVVWDAGPHVCGNPCPVVDARTGRIHLLLTHNLGQDSEREIIDGTSEGSRTVWVLTSDDEGATWSAPRELTDTTKRPDWTWYATGPGVGVQLTRGAHAGRFVVPCDHIEAGSKRYFSHVILSDDGGATWRIGGASARDRLNECQAAELSDGSLVLNMRNYDRAKRARAVARSTDGGETFGPVTWDEALPEPICQAGLIALDVTHAGAHDAHQAPNAGDGVPAAERARRLVFSNPASPDQRERMTLKASDDGGVSWREVAVLHAGPAAYSCLVALPAADGAPRVGCLFERGTAHPYEHISFSRCAVPGPASTAK